VERNVELLKICIAVIWNPVKGDDVVKRTVVHDKKDRATYRTLEDTKSRERRGEKEPFTLTH
jgi:hypothetical protein